MSDKKPDTAGVVVVKGSDVKAESGYEATMPHGFGIGTQTGSKTLNVHTAYLEPGQATRAHFHLYSDGACYVLEGEILLVTYNENYEKLEQVVRAGDFIYIPRGVIHKFINRSETDASRTSGYTTTACTQTTARRCTSTTSSRRSIETTDDQSAISPVAEKPS